MAEVGEQRAQAANRLFALPYTLLVSLPVGLVAALIGVVWGVVDILGFQLIFNSNYLSERGTAQNIVVGAVKWTPKNLAFAATGRGELMWTPDLGMSMMS